MNQRIQHKIDQFKKMATHPSSRSTSTASGDSLSKVIRSKQDAENFMAELENAVKRAK